MRTERLVGEERPWLRRVIPHRDHSTPQPGSVRPSVQREHAVAIQRNELARLAVEAAPSRSRELLTPRRERCARVGARLAGLLVELPCGADQPPVVELRDRLLEMAQALLHPPKLFYLGGVRRSADIIRTWVPSNIGSTDSHASPCDSETNATAWKPLGHSPSQPLHVEVG